MKRYFIIFYRYVIAPRPVSTIPQLAAWTMSSSKEGMGMITMSTEGATSAPYLNMAELLTEISKSLEPKDECKGAKVIITGIQELSQSDHHDWLKGHQDYAKNG